MARNVQLNTLLESVDREINAELRVERFGVDPFSDVTGFHVYGELNLTLQLTAASDTKDAQQLLKVLQEYALVAEACASESAAKLLEVQGERIHLLIPSGEVNRESVSNLLGFAVAFSKAVYARISQTAGDAFKGFRMAADHGRAILVASGTQPNASIVSLGPAANAPAKELKKRGKAAHLRMRSAHYAHIAPPSARSDWFDVPILDPSETVTAISNQDLNERFGRKSDQFIAESLKTAPNVLFADDAFLRAFTGTVGQAIKVQGFPLRADVDGFSKEVELSFSAGERGILALVQRFVALMQYPVQFRQRLGKTIDLPWAGDCANLIVLPNGSGYADAREFLPVKAASEWHSQRSGNDANKRKWTEYFGNAKWAVGIAGGDDKEGSNGYVLVAPIAGRNRNFLVAAGWGIGRSLDAQEADGVAGDDTVIHDLDYRALDTAHQATFKELDSIFWISHGLTNKSVKCSGIGVLASQAPAYAPHVTKPVPQPRPWLATTRLF